MQPKIVETKHLSNILCKINFKGNTMEEKEMIDEIIETISASVVERVFADERFVALTTPKAEEVVEEEVKEEVVEETTPTEEEKVEVVDKRSTIEKIRDRLKGIK